MIINAKITIKKFIFWGCLMRYRKRVRGKRNRVGFARSARRTKKLNLGRKVMRGGYRL